MNKIIQNFTPFSPASYKEMMLNPFTLSFHGQLEHDFTEYYNRAILKHVRLTFLAALFLYSSCGMLDIIVAPGYLLHLGIIRFGVLLPAAVAFLALTFHRWGKRHLQLLLGSLTLIAGMGVIEMIRVLPSEYGYTYNFGLILVFIFMFTFSRIRFIWAFLTGLFLVCVYEILLIWVKDTPELYVFTNNFFIISTAVVTLVTCYLLEFSARRDFYLNRLIKREQEKTEEINRELEHRVLERTKQLTRANFDLKREVEIRKISVEALIQNEEKYRLLFEMFVIPIVITNNRWIITDVNKAGLKLFEYDEDGMIGVSLKVLFSDGEDFARMKAMLKTRGQIRNFKTMMLRQDGWRIECMVSTSPRSDSDGSVLNYQVFINDVTEYRKLENQLIHAQKMESVGRLAGGIAHDFNNLLTVIIGNVDLINALIPKDHEISEFIQEIKHTAERAANLTRHLLTFSHRQIVEPRVVNISEILIEMDKLFRRLIGEEIELVTLLEEKLWPVKIDPGQLEQVMTNIVVNARDAMPNGGKLTIETFNVTVDEDHVTMQHDMSCGEYVMVAIGDTGVGMTEETINRIFEPFYTTKEKGKGTGLGLSTCYGIIKQNNGHIMVRSKPGHGSTFIIYLPRASGVAENVSLNQVKKEIPRGTETILVAEDEPSVRNVLTRILSDAGYTVIEAHNGEEALRKCELHGSRNIDLLVTDVVMPQMGGRELAEHIKKVNPSIRTLFISGYTDDMMLHSRIHEEGIAFVQKPFSSSHFVQKVRALLDTCIEGEKID